MNANARLEDAVKAKDPRRVRQALKKGADPNLQFRRPPCSALCRAAAAGDAAMVRALLEAGARPCLDKSATALHAAVASASVEVLEILLEAGGKRLLDCFDGDEFTPLMRAVDAGDIEMAQRLLAAGSDVNARQEALYGNTALRIAAASGTLEMVKLLLEAGADPLVPGRMLLTPLDRARERDTPEGRMITALMERTLASRAAAHNGPRVRRAKQR